MLRSLPKWYRNNHRKHELKGRWQWLVIVGILVAMLQAPLFLSGGRNLAREVQYDFPSFYFASVLVFTKRQSPYNHNSLQALGQATGLKRDVFPFLYPPVSLLPLALVSRMSFDRSRQALNHLNHVLLTSVIVIFAGLFREKHQAFLACAGLFIFTNVGVLETLQIGQLNIVIAASCAAAWLGLIRRWHPIWVALPIVLAVMLKTYHVLLIPYLIAKGQYRAAAYAVGFCAVACGLSVILLPDGLWREWFFEIAPRGVYLEAPFQSFSAGNYSNQSLNGVIARYSESHQLSLVIPYIFACAIVGVTLTVAFWVTRRYSDKAFVDYAGMLVAIFLVAPLSWIHHLTFVIPAALVLMYAIFTERFYGWRLGLAALILIGVGCNIHFFGSRLNLGTLFGSLPFAAAFALWAWITIYAWRLALPHTDGSEPLYSES
jgi:hypothetical protein